MVTGAGATVDNTREDLFLAVVATVVVVICY